MLEDLANAVMNPFGMDSASGTTNGTLAAGTDVSRVERVGLNEVFQRYGNLRVNQLSDQEVAHLADMRGEADGQVVVARQWSREAAGLARARLQLARIAASHQRQMMGIHKGAADLAVQMTQAKGQYQLEMGQKQAYIDAWTRQVNVSHERMTGW